MPPILAVLPQRRRDRSNGTLQESDRAFASGENGESRACAAVNSMVIVLAPFHSRSVRGQEFRTPFSSRPPQRRRKRLLRRCPAAVNGVTSAMTVVRGVAPVATAIRPTASSLFSGLL